VVHEAWGALSAITAVIKEDKPVYLNQAIQVLRHLGGDELTPVAGLCLPRGIEPCVAKKIVFIAVFCEYFFFFGFWDFLSFSFFSSQIF
jgi:hypothetical protein